MAEPDRLASPSMEVVASYTTYGEAQRAVDFLADRRFPVERVTIVARDLRFEEQVTGRIGYGTAMMEGAASGAVTGALLGFILGIFTLITPLASGMALAFWGLVIGGIIGSVVGLLAHALAGGRRDFSSIRRLDAGRYDLIAARDVAEHVRRVLSDRPLTSAA